MVLRRLFKKARRARQPRRRQLLLERLASRELFAVDPMGVVTGSVFTDLANDGDINAIVDTSGVTVSDPVHSGVQVELYRDNNNDGAIDGGDALAGTATTNDSGEFRFEGLSAGDYLLSQEAIAGLLAPSGPVAVTVTDDSGQQVTGIDNFSEAAQLITVSDSADQSDSAGDGTVASVIGGARDLLLVNNSGGGEAKLEVDGQLRFSTEVGITATALIQYDGVDDSSDLDATGLDGADLTGSNQGAGLLLGALSDFDGGTLTVRIYTDANNASETVINPPSGAMFEEFFVPFSDITTLGGATGPADFSNVGAIESFLEGEPGWDARVSVISSLAPVEVIQNLANSEAVSVGDTIFRDNDDNGIQNAGEPGIVGVDVNLYADINANGTFDAGTDGLIDTTTSGVDGAYLFEGLVPGDYIVQIPSSEFSLGQPLFGFGTSQDPTTDPDDNIDGDNSGEELTGQGVVSQAITLSSRGEPTDDGDADPNTNLTLDFGFVPEIDLVVDKELTTTDPVAGGEVNFQITITNNGPLQATNVTLVDPLPTGLTFDRVENVPNGVTTSVSGNQLTADLGTLAAGAGNAITFNVIAILASGSPGETFTNEATITADERDIEASNDTDTADVTAPSNDLRITKTSGNDPVSAGGTLTYTLQVFNDGPDGATGVVVTDSLPVDVTFVSGAIGDSDANVSHDNGVVTADIGNLASGASETITIQVSVASDAPASLDNTASVTSTPDIDVDVTNNSATETIAVDRDVDVEISKTASATPNAGETFTYTFNVTNSGLGDARGVTVTDTLDDDVTFVSMDAQESGVTVSQSGNVLTFDVGTLVASGTATFSIDVTTPSNAFGQLTNTATVATTDDDTDTSNDTDTTNVTLGRLVDLSVTKDDDVAVGIPGQSMTYTLTVTNSGPSDASGVQMADTLPANFSLTSAVAGGIPFTNADGVVTFNVGNLASGDDVSVTLTGRIDASATGTLANSVTVSGNETDSDSSNDIASVTTTLTPEFDLSIEKSASGSDATPGGTLTYEIDVDNAGPSDATNVMITDTLPAGVTFVSGSLGGVDATVDGSNVSFALGTLDASESVSGTLVLKIASTKTGTLTNQVTVSADAGDTNAGNNSDTVKSTLTPSVDLAVSKDVSKTTAAAGSELTYTILVSNSGLSAATGVTAIDTLPAGVTFVSGTGPNGQALSANGRTVDVTIGALDAKATAQFTITATINENVTQDQTNHVVVATPLTETNTNNNSASATTTIDRDAASIEGVVYIDADNDGVRDTGEIPLAGVTLNLSGTNSQGESVSETTTTDANGVYRFSGLSAGTYAIEQVQPATNQNGMLIADGKETVGQNATAAVEENGFSEIILGANVQATAFNFGEIPLPISIRYLMSQNYSFLDQRQ